MSRCVADFDHSLAYPTVTDDKEYFATGPQKSGEGSFGILTEAANIVQGIRNSQNGDKERSFNGIASMWNAYLATRKDGGEITAFDVAQMMALLKMVRANQGTRIRDHFVDQAGYTGIAGEIAENG